MGQRDYFILRSERAGEYGIYKVLFFSSLYSFGYILHWSRLKTYIEMATSTVDWTIGGVSYY